MSFDFPLEVAKRRKRLTDTYVKPGQLAGVTGMLQGMYTGVIDELDTPTLKKFREAAQLAAYEQAVRRMPLITFFQQIEQRALSL